MRDIVERLRIGRETCGVDMCRIREAKSGCTCAEAADEIERLREALQGAKTIINLLCQGFDVEPENVVINVTSENEDGEEVFVKSISAQDVLTEIRAALGEKE